MTNVLPILATPTWRHIRRHRLFKQIVSAAGKSRVITDLCEERLRKEMQRSNLVALILDDQKETP